MLELGIGADLLRGLGWVFWGLYAFALLIVLSRTKGVLGWLAGFGVVTAIFFGPMVPGVISKHEQDKRYAKAKALFDERCKTAGEKIYKTVEGVEGVLLIDTRGLQEVSNYALRDWPYAGFPTESSGVQYIMEFLYYNRPAAGQKARGLGWIPGGVKGYSTVDVDIDGKRRRFSLKAPSDYKNLANPLLDYADELPPPSEAPRYVVKYESLSDPEGRTHWVAGGRVVVLDQKTQEVLGEFIRYAFEPGMGSTAGFRSPWAFAHQCPLTSYGGSNGHIRSFVERVIVPAQGGE